MEHRHTDIPALCDEYAQGEEDEEHAGACPSVCVEGCRFVEIALVYLSFPG